MWGYRRGGGAGFIMMSAEALQSDLDFPNFQNFR